MPLGDKLKEIGIEELPHYDRLTTVRAWDLAATDGSGDYTAGLLVSFDKETGTTYLWGAAHEQYSPKKVEHLVATNAEHDGNGIPIWIEQEPGSAGKSLIAHYQDDVLPTFSVQGEKSTGPIEVRAQPFLAAVENGKVCVVRGKWVQAFKDELDGFPEADHDDLLTAASLGFKKAYRGQYGGLSWGRSRKRGSFDAAMRGRKKVGGVVW
jgi:predicted phage terminase large subunit-like protein